MRTATNESNKLIVLKAFDTLFNERDYETALRFWSADYIQHSAHIEAGREGLFTLTKALPASLRYENAHAAADGELVILHGRFSGHGLRRNWVVSDIVRLENGILVEHWDVIQDEATEAESKSGLPMFGSQFAPADGKPVAEGMEGYGK
jgi:predicted SnoaL-like aldol condensation-catalyzing enzyme